MLSRVDVENLLQDYGLKSVFDSCVKGALQDWYDNVAAKPELMAGALPRERATFVNRRVIWRIERELKGRPDIAFNHIQQQTLMTVADRVNFRFKQLNYALRPMSIRTRRVERLWFHNTTPLPGPFDQWINVTFGWKLSITGAVKALAVVNEYGGRLSWIIPVDHDDNSGMLPEQMPLPTPPADEPQVYVARIRDTERARRIAEMDKPAQEAEDNTG